MRPNRRSSKPRRGLWRAISFFLMLAVMLSVLATASARAREDLAGWDRTRWGMTPSDLERRFGPALETASPPIDYGASEASRVLRRLEFAGFAWRVLFQFDRGKHGLEQVMLERSQLPYAPKVFEAALTALEASYGPPDLVCDSPPGSSAKHLERVWRLATTSFHLVALNIGSGELQYDVLQWPPDPQNGAWPRRFHPNRSYPQRVLIRYHPTARIELFLPGCGR
jgi:hypothetical protein